MYLDLRLVLSRLILSGTNLVGRFQILRTRFPTGFHFSPIPFDVQQTLMDGRSPGAGN